MIDVGTTRTIVNRFFSCCKEENSFEICCSFNEKINNGEFAISDAPTKLTKNALKGLDKDNNRLDCDSIVSAATTNKTVGDCTKKHHVGSSLLATGQSKKRCSWWSWICFHDEVPGEQ